MPKLTPDSPLLTGFFNLLAAGYDLTHASNTAGLNPHTVRRLYKEGQEQPQSVWHPFATRVTETLERVERSLAASAETRVTQELAARDAQGEWYFTEERKTHMLDSIRRGVYPESAAERAGVPRTVFLHWLEQARTSPYENDYTRFHSDFLAACAEARADAEERVHEQNPLAWLLSSPTTRERGDGTGWTKQEQITTRSVQVAVIETKWGNSSVTEEKSMPPVVESPRTLPPPAESRPTTPHGRTETDAE